MNHLRPKTSLVSFILATALAVFLVPTEARAETGVSYEGSFGVFFEFGDEAGFSGGFALWIGAPIYPSVDPSDSGAAFFVSPGVELRTGMIPLLTGPNEVSPQIRPGVAILGPQEDRRDTVSNPDDLTFPDVKLAAILGYRWAFEFGLDNMDGRRKNESALRLGLDVRSAGLLRLTDPIPVLNMLGGHVDVNTDGSVDRYGFMVGFGI